MQWIAPAEKNGANDLLEKRLWSAADQLRANSGLSSAQYSQPVLGLIFLRFADSRFKVQLAKIEKAGKTSRRGSRAEDPAAYHAEGILYLAPGARFDELPSYPEGGKGGKSLGQAINEAMRNIERDNPQLAGVLPKTYEAFESRTLAELLKVISTIPADLEGDSFGKIYEYFLGEFAMTEGQAGGEFFTPTAIVRLIVEILEPFHGQILDPACGSGGMFVQSARFVAEHRKNPSSEISICGQEKVDATVRLCQMNLAAHGLEGDIKQAITYYDDLHKSTGRFDFVLANPPFNVNAVDKERLTADVGPGKRFPFGLPKTDNANYLWIQLFYSTLNSKGRAGFVMANSASDARSSEQELRKQLIEDKAVEAVVAVGPNMFYTVTLPCTLWFIDKAKAKLPPCQPSPQPSPKGRGGFRFQGLVEQARELRKQQTSAEEALWQLLRNRQLESMKFRRQHQIGDYIVDFFCAEHGLIVELDGAVHGTPGRKKVDAKRDAYLRSLGHTVLRFPNDRVFDDTEGMLAEIISAVPSPSGRGKAGEGEQLRVRGSDTVLFIDARHIYRQIDRAHRDWTPEQIGFISNIVRLYREEEPDFTLGGEGANKKVTEVFGKKPKYQDILGLCKVATIKEIEKQGWSLNPGRYVGVAPGEAVSDEDFKEQLETLNEELEALNAQARSLEQTIARNVKEILEL